jgi:hypothetical protein
MEHLANGWRAVVRHINTTVDETWGGHAPDLLESMTKLVRQLRAADRVREARRPLVVYVHKKAARQLGILLRVRTRVEAKRRRGPRLRDLVRSPSRAKRRACL